METFKTYLFSYNHEGASWSFEIKARDQEDAMARLARLPFARYDGELMLSIPVGPAGPWLALIRLWRWLRGQSG